MNKEHSDENNYPENSATIVRLMLAFTVVFFKYSHDHVCIYLLFYSQYISFVLIY